MGFAGRFGGACKPIAWNERMSQQLINKIQQLNKRLDKFEEKQNAGKPKYTRIPPLEARATLTKLVGGLVKMRAEQTTGATVPLSSSFWSDVSRAGYADNSPGVQLKRQAEDDLQRIQPYLESDSTLSPDLLAEVIDRHWAMSREDFYRLCLTGDTETGLILLEMEIERRKAAGTWTEDEVSSVDLPTA